jgi:hypothetical protein
LTESFRPSGLAFVARPPIFAFFPRLCQCHIHMVDSVCQCAVQGHFRAVKHLLTAHPEYVNTPGCSTALAFPCPPIFHAAAANRHRAIRDLVELGADVNLPNARGSVALHMAARSGACEAATELLMLGARADVADSVGDSPLVEALTYENDAVADILAKTGARLPESVAKTLAPDRVAQLNKVLPPH